jgi:hypothetical protein
LKILIKNVNILNMLLLALAAGFLSYGLFPSFSLEAGHVLPVSRESMRTEEPDEEARIPSIAEYANISDDNLFHPERKIPPAKTEEQALPKPEFILYGTLVTDTVRIAYVEDMKAYRSTPGRGRRQVALGEGDILSGFTVKKIGGDSVVMSRGEEKIVLPVHDPSRQKESAEAALTTSTVKQPRERTATPQGQRDLRRQNITDRGRSASSVPPRSSTLGTLKPDTNTTNTSASPAQRP